MRGFTKKYNVSKLVYRQATDSLESARAREKQIKGWLRSKKVELIETENPRWVDLAYSWEEGTPPPQALRPAAGLRETSRKPQIGVSYS